MYETCRMIELHMHMNIKQKPKSFQINEDTVILDQKGAQEYFAL